MKTLEDCIKRVEKCEKVVEADKKISEESDWIASYHKEQLQMALEDLRYFKQASYNRIFYNKKSGKRKSKFKFYVGDHIEYTEGRPALIRARWIENNSRIVYRICYLDHEGLENEVFKVVPESDLIGY